MFNYDFMQNAFIAGTIVAIMAGYIGVFVMARNMSFISHTLSHVGFAGAAFAVFLGINPIYGLLIFTITMSYLVGHLSVKAFRREATVSVMLGIFLGLGLLFLSLTPKSTSYVNNILFGSVVSITRDDVKLIFTLALAVILLLSIFYRKIKTTCCPRFFYIFFHFNNLIILIIFFSIHTLSSFIIFLLLQLNLSLAD